MSIPARADILAVTTAAAGLGYIADIGEKAGRLVGGAAPVELTIASGSVDAESGSPALGTPVVTIDTESDAASDVLDNITVSEFEDGEFILVGLENAARVVTLTHEATGAGQMSLAHGADLTLFATDQWVLFRVDKGSPDTLTEVARYGIDRVRVEASTAGVGSPNVLLDGESGKVVTNEGAGAAAYNTLPTARAGLTFTFYIQDGTQGMVVTAASGDTIRTADGVSTAGGTATHAGSSAGDVLVLVAVNGTEWVAVSEKGTWTVST